MQTNHQARRYAKMPWGKHRGVYIKDLSDSYINWCVQNYRQDSLALWFKEEQSYRNKHVKEQKNKQLA